MIYGIEQTTDSRYPETKIWRFRSEPAALNWRDARRIQAAWPGAADPDLPVGQQNFHHRIRRLYRMPKGWRSPGKKVLLMEAAHLRCRLEDFQARAIRRDGEELA